ncbi:hypothetical protein [Bacteroidetes bacterium endosymbiont of Geopemphigus sp.]|uniref:hypothetical protein n=1 Tax=Bacteroidetes bacterium endosymbiont of Geopemphigus sp. TaxID=2047937 RepID=UPI000CD17487|nr:hypothetical protein [Bacteroidetes bacterium endosymbiont of Geopemphigus sp.]
MSFKNVFGIVGILDIARYRFAIAEALGCPASERTKLGYKGAHNETMIPMIYTRFSSIPLSELLSFEKMRFIEE